MEETPTYGGVPASTEPWLELPATEPAREPAARSVVVDGSAVTAATTATACSFSDMLKAKARIKCKGVETVEYPLWDLHLASSVVRDCVTACDPELKQEGGVMFMDVGTCDFWASTVKTALGWIAKQNQLHKIVNQVQTLKLMHKHLHEKALQIPNSTVRRMAMEAGSDAKQDAAAIDKALEPLGLLLHNDCVEEIVKFLHQFAIDCVLDPLISLINLRPTTRSVWAVDSVHPLDPSWAEESVVFFLKHKIKENRIYLKQGKGNGETTVEIRVGRLLTLTAPLLMRVLLECEFP